VTTNQQRNGTPAIDRYSRDRIGRELRAIYEPFVQEPLPDAFLALLRTWQEAEAAQYRLKRAVEGLREANTESELSIAPRSASALSVHAQQTLLARAFGAREQSGAVKEGTAGVGRHKGWMAASPLLYARRRTS
jgi:hypothetical protein